MYVSRISPGISAVSVFRCRSLEPKGLPACSPPKVSAAPRSSWLLALSARCPSLPATPPRISATTAPRAVHGDTIVFTSEGDLWTVSIHGGAAHRLTSAPGKEDMATISPDGLTVAFRAQLRRPRRGLHHAHRRRPSPAPDLGWRRRARRLGPRWPPHHHHRALRHAARIPASCSIGSHGEREQLPLATGEEAAYSADGKTLFFTRSKTREATPNATRADSSSTSGAGTATAKPFLSPRTMPAPRTIPCSGTAASTSSPIAMAS